jgi:protein O-GlcNAc transferase
VQASWLGYFATTGLAEMDYVLADPYVVPVGEEDQFTEAVWRLPDSYLCFTAPAVDVEVGPLPALSAGQVTFGCFNNLAKMNDAVVTLWARVLHAVPGSRLFLKTKQLSSAASGEATRQRFRAHGIGPERLILEGASPRHELLAAYHRVDIALDPFPYPGGTTSVEAMWMGVPVITRRGDRFLSHVGESIAHNAGLPAWIAGDDDDYVARAASHASRLPELAALRGELRARVMASPLFDAPRFARNFEAAMWGMWERHRDRQSPPG